MATPDEKITGGYIIPYIKKHNKPIWPTLVKRETGLDYAFKKHIREYRQQMIYNFVDDCVELTFRFDDE